jgi:hypothetical protein
MARSAPIAMAAALLLAGTSLASAKTRAAAGAHENRKPDITATTSHPTTPDPYFRLSDPYYGYSDPYRGLYDFYAVPPYIPGYTYGHVRPGGWQQ